MIFHNEDIEQQALAKILSDPESLKIVGSQFAPERFYTTLGRNIATAINNVYKGKKMPDIVNVHQECRRLKYDISPSDISSLTFKAVGSFGLDTDLLIIQELWIKREAQKIYQESLLKINNGDDIFDVFESNNKLVGDLYATISANSSYHISDLNNAFLEQQAKIKESGHVGIYSGIRSIDEIYKGFKDTNLIIWAARPGMGKTSLLLSVAKNVALQDIGVGIFSLEMSADELYKRLISQTSMIPTEWINKGLDEHQMEGIQNDMKTLIDRKMVFDDTAALSIVDMRARARKWVNSGIKIIFVDYLQLMRPGQKAGNREQEISIISAGLKQMAKELKVPVIALSQLSRAVETRGGNKKPVLSDLRDSGSIEQDADIVSFIYRPEYYGISCDEHGNTTLGQGFLITAKNRDGGLGESVMKFEPIYTLYKDI